MTNSRALSLKNLFLLYCFFIMNLLFLLFYHHCLYEIHWFLMIQIIAMMITVQWTSNITRNMLFWLTHSDISCWVTLSLSLFLMIVHSFFYINLLALLFPFLNDWFLFSFDCRLFCRIRVSMSWNSFFSICGFLCSLDILILIIIVIFEQLLKLWFSK